MSQITLKNQKTVGDYLKPYIIAEIGANHNGDMSLAKKMIDSAKEAGCDCVKFQSWTKDSLFSKSVYESNPGLAEMVEGYSVAENELLEMKQYCDTVGIDFASTPFSKKETDFLVDVCDVPFIKIASMDLNNYPFLEYVAKKGLPIFISTGLSEISEIDKAIRTIETAGNKRISILHCTAVYPPKLTDVNLKFINTLRSIYPDYPIGYSDHTLGIEIPLAAIALGACVIEKHFTMDKAMEGWDHAVSADAQDMTDIVRHGSNICTAMGFSRKVVGSDELDKGKVFRRSVVAVRDLKQGHILTESDMDTKRPGTGLPPETMSFLVGQRLTADVSADEMILKKHIEG